MKKTLFILLGVFAQIFVSCNDRKVVELNARILELETENRKLTDSITEMQYSRILNSKVFGSANQPTFMSGEENTVTFEFYNTGKMPEYKVYRLSADGKRENLVYDKRSENGFEYSFTPDKKGEFQIKLLTVFNTKTEKYGEIEIPAYLTVDVTE